MEQSKRVKWSRLRAAGLLTCGLLLVGMARIVFAAPATLVTDAPLKAEPSFKAKSITTLKKDSEVEINKRQRGWYLVESANNQSGWVTLLQLRYERMENVNQSSGLSKLIGLRKGHSDITATTGVRGIGEADIKNAKADFSVLKAALQYKTSTEDARRFGREAGLTGKTIKYQEK